MRCYIQKLSVSLMLLCAAGLAYAQQSEDAEALSELERLMSVEISTAARYGQKAAEAPSSVTIVTAEDIEKFGYEKLSDVLRNVSGFYTSYDRNYYYAGVRGFSRPSDFNNRIRLLLNGHSIYESFDGSTFVGSELAITLDAVERIEIVRGPSSALYGTGAMLAVINIVTRDCSTLDGLQLSTSSGSFGSRHASAVLSRGLAGGNHLLLTGRLANSDGPRLYFKDFDLLTSNHGVAERRDWEKGRAFLATADWGDIRIQAMHSNREKALPTASYGTVFNDGQTRTVDSYGFVEASLERPVSAALELTVRGYFDSYRYRGWWPYEEENAFDRTIGEAAGIELLARLDFSASQRLLTALELQRHAKVLNEYWGDSSGVFNKIDKPYNVLSFTIQDEFKPLRALSLFGGMRFDSYQRQGSYVAPRLGAVYVPTDRTSLKFMYGKAFRVPTSSERFYEDPMAGYKANPNLEEEGIVTRELALEHRASDAVQLSAAAFSYTMSDLVDYIVDPVDSLTQLRNVSSVDAIGTELNARVMLGRNFSAIASYTLQKTRGSDDGEQITNSPMHLMKVGLWSAFLKHLSGSAQLNYESERRTVYETRTKSFLLADLQLTIDPRIDRPTGLGALLDCTKLSLRIRNAFDKTYSLPGGFEHIQDALTQDGRTYELKLTFKL